MSVEKWTTDNIRVWNGDQKICYLERSSTDGPMIAAAPDLLEALEDALSHLPPLHYRQAKAAIAKAKGEQS